MSNTTYPDVPAIFKVNESLDIFASMLCALTYGIALTLYCMVVQSLYRRLRQPSSGQHKVALITLSYTTFAIVCTTVWFGIVHYFTQMAYVFHRDDYWGGPFIYEALVLYKTPSYLAALIFAAMLDWLTMSVQIWRLWILWRHSTYFVSVITLPVCFLLACIGVDITAAVRQAHIDWLSWSAVESTYALGFAFFGIPPATTIVVTTLMVSRLVLIRKRHINLTGHPDLAAKQYTGVIAMVTESYAIDALWSIGIIVTYALHSPVIWIIFVNSYLNMKVIALFLIVYRVANGQAWRAHTERQLSTWRCNDNTFRTPETSELELTTVQRFSTGPETA